MKFLKKNIPFLKKILIEHGIKPSLQRVAILNYLIENKNHPNIDKIFNETLPFIPTLSKTTVYNTVKSFVEKGFVTSFLDQDNTVVYDLMLEPHVHFQCIECKEIYDCVLDGDTCKLEVIDGHRIIKKSVVFMGICKKCLAKKNKNNS